MGNRTVFWLMLALLLVAVVAGVGYYAYSAGVAHALACRCSQPAAGRTAW